MMFDLDILHHAGRAAGSEDWVDHTGVTTEFGRKVFVAEPYHVTAADLVAIQTIAKECDLEFSVSPHSWWFPTRTWRISLWPRDPQPSPQAQPSSGAKPE
jgi:hypothetical protein